MRQLGKGRVHKTMDAFRGKFGGGVGGQHTPGRESPSPECPTIRMLHRGNSQTRGMMCQRRMPPYSFHVRARAISNYKAEETHDDWGGKTQGGANSNYWGEGTYDNWGGQTRHKGGTAYGHQGNRV